MKFHEKIYYIKYYQFCWHNKKDNVKTLQVFIEAARGSGDIFVDALPLLSLKNIVLNLDNYAYKIFTEIGLTRQAGLAQYSLHPKIQRILFCS